MSTKKANIRFDMDNELHRKAWQLLQDRDKNIYPSYSQAVVCALIELFAEDAPYTGNSKEHDELLSEISDVVERAAEKAFERTLPSFFAGYMACAAGMRPAGNTFAYVPAEVNHDEAIDEDAADDIDFDFLGLT